LKVKTLDDREISLEQASIDALKMSLRGVMFFPGDAGYEESRTLWNSMTNRKPAFVVRCIGVSDVIKSVNFARENKLLLSIKGGGHNIAGLAAADGAMMLDMSLMRGVWVDPKNKIAYAEAGCILGDVDCETQVHGLATVLGFVSLTGITGLTLGGGFGYLTRRWGWTSDNVLSMNLVTADGKLTRASNDENSDLFWALLGGGGNFGVVTGIEYKLYEVGPEVTGGIVAWPASEAPKILELYRELSSKAPRELTLVSIMRPAPPAPWLPQEIHGKTMAAILACYTGRSEEAEKIIAQLKSFGSPVGDVLIKRPYVQLQSMLDATQPKGRRYYWKSEYLPGIEPALCEKVIENALKICSPHSGIILFQIGGALNDLSEDHSPVGNRDAKYVINIGGSWEQEADDSINIEWARNTWNSTKEFSTGGNYINFLTEDESEERVHAALGNSIKRLSEVKKKWDPENMFRVNRNVKPA
jgi:hypothetical protein